MNELTTKYQQLSSAGCPDGRAALYVCWGTDAGNIDNTDIYELSDLSGVPEDDLRYFALRKIEE